MGLAGRRATPSGREAGDRTVEHMPSNSGSLGWAVTAVTYPFSDMWVNPYEPNRGVDGRCSFSSGRDGDRLQPLQAVGYCFRPLNDIVQFTSGHGAE
jgi:hypothetical protein